MIKEIYCRREGERREGEGIEDICAKHVDKTSHLPAHGLASFAIMLMLRQVDHCGRVGNNLAHARGLWLVLLPHEGFMLCLGGCRMGAGCRLLFEVPLVMLRQPLANLLLLLEQLLRLPQLKCLLLLLGQLSLLLLMYGLALSDLLSKFLRGFDGGNERRVEAHAGEGGRGRRRGRGGCGKSIRINVWAFVDNGFQEVLALAFRSDLVVWRLLRHCTVVFLVGMHCAPPFDIGLRCISSSVKEVQANNTLMNNYICIYVYI